MHIELLKCTFGYKILFSYYGVKFFYALINLFYKLYYIKYTLSKYTLSYIIYKIYKNNYDAVVKAH